MEYGGESSCRMAASVFRSSAVRSVGSGCRSRILSYSEPETFQRIQSNQYRSQMYGRMILACQGR